MAAHVQDMTEGVPLRKIVSFGIPILLGTLFQQLYGLADTMVVGYTLGIAVITAHTASRRVLELLSQPLGSLCAAFSVFTAQNYGGRKPARIRLALRQVLLLGTGWSILATFLVYLFGGSAIRFISGTTDPAVLTNAVLCLRIALPFYPMLGAVFCLRNGLQSIGIKTVPILSSAVELMIKLLSAWFLIDRIGYLGVCVTEPVSWTLMALFLGGAYLIKYRSRLSEETQ